MIYEPKVELATVFGWRPIVYQLLATILTYAALNIAFFYRRRHKRFQLFKYYQIPGPEPCLYDGNMSLYLSKKRNLISMEEDLRQKYGKVIGIFAGDEPSIIVTDLDILKKVFLPGAGSEVESFRERSILFLESPISSGILMARHHRWKAMRRVMSPAFTGYAVRAGSPAQSFIEHSLGLMLDYLDRKLGNKPDSSGKFDDDVTGDGRKEHQQVDIHDLMKSTALHMISAMAIKLPNVRVEENEPNVISLDWFLGTVDRGPILWVVRFPFVRRILEFLAKWLEFDKTLARSKKTLNKAIDNHRHAAAIAAKNNGGAIASKQSHLIDQLIELHYEGKMSRPEVIANALSILFAGYDTTSTTLTYLFWALAKHQEVQERLRIELTAHGTNSKYLEQVINETMRLYPTVRNFTTRLATKTTIINGLIIPKGLRVIYNALLIHRDPQVWPDPMRFDPERFREGVEHHPCAFAPFGMGERKCLGYQLAKLELKMITCDLLLRYKLRLKSPIDLELVSYAAVLTKPKEKVMIELERL